MQIDWSCQAFLHKILWWYIINCDKKWSICQLCNEIPFMDQTPSSCHREQVSLAIVEYMAMIWLLMMIDPLFIKTHWVFQINLETPLLSLSFFNRQHSAGWTWKTNWATLQNYPSSSHNTNQCTILLLYLSLQKEKVLNMQNQSNYVAMTN